MSKNILQHVAIIMDGNGRWAKKRGRDRISGHQEGFKSVKKAINFSILNNFKMLTLYAFSKENWSRPILEIKALMNLFILLLEYQIKYLHKNNIRFNVIGDISDFSLDLQNSIKKAKLLTVNNSGLILNIAANYSGKWDIIQGIKKVINQIKKGNLKAEQIQEETFSKYLSTNFLLPVDLVIRTGGEKRLSNFFLWQIAYSELYFTDILWPDFNYIVFYKAINFFYSRKRRFGSLNNY